MTIPARLKLLLLLTTDATTVCGSQIATLILLHQWYENSLTPIASVLAFIIVSLASGFYRTSISHVGVGAVKQVLIAVVISGVVIYLLNESARLALFSSVLT